MNDQPLQWRTSTKSGAAGHCVEVAFAGPDDIRVRQSHQPDGDVLRFTDAEWDAFVDGAKAGEFDFGRP